MASTNLELVLSLVDQASKQMKKVQSNIDSSFSGMVDKAQSAGKKMTAISAGIAGLTFGAFKIVEGASQAGDEIDKMSQKLGLSREGFQEWDFILSQSGTNIRSMNTGMKTLTQRMDESMQGVGAGAEAFERLGLDIEGSMSQEEAFESTILALQNMDEGIEKSALANELFGRSGQELLPLLNASRGSVEELKERYDDLGLGISGNAVDAFVRLTDSFDQVKRGVSNLTLELVGNFMPEIEALVEWIITTAIPNFRKFLDENLTPIIEKFIEWKNENEDLFKKLMIVFGGITILMGVLGPLLIILPFIVSGIKILISVFAFLLGPVGLVIAIIGLLILAVMKLIEIWNLLKIIVPQVWDVIKNAISEKVNQIKERFETFKTNVSEIWTNLWESLRQTFENLWESIKAPIQRAFDWLKSMFDKIKNTVGSIGSAVSGAVGAVTGIFKKNGNRAIGGPVNPNSSYLVGENGPEIFTPSTNGRISQMGGSGVNVNVTVSGNTISNKLDLRDLANQVGDQIIKDLRLAYRV